MLYAYIGVALVIGLLIGFVALSVIWLSGRVSKGIQNRTVELMSSYDALLEERSRRLEAIEARLQEVQDTYAASGREKMKISQTLADNGMAMLNMAERMNRADYVDNRLGSTYRQIRYGFDQDPIGEMHRLGCLRPYEPGAATRLLEELSYNTVYRMSTLASAEQYELVQEVLDEEQVQLLQAYMEEHSRFDIIGFYDYLKAAATLEPQKPRLFVSPMYDGPHPAEVEIIEDPDICEGFQIEVDNVLYDYCIKGRELS